MKVRQTETIDGKPMTKAIKVDGTRVTFGDQLEIEVDESVGKTLVREYERFEKVEEQSDEEFTELEI